MANLTAERYHREQTCEVIQIGVDGGASKIFEGAMVSALTATGMAVRAGTASSGFCRGVARHTVDNSGGSDADLSINLDHRRPFWFSNSAGGDEITAAEKGKKVFIADDQTVAKTNDGYARAVAGICLDVDANLGVLVYVDAALNEALAELETILSTGLGVASKAIGFADLTDSDGSQTIDFDDALPAGAMVVGYGANVTAIFDNVGDTAGVTFDLGIASGDTDVWVDGGSLNAVAKVSTPSGTGASLVGAVTPSVIIDADVDVDTLTKGAAVFYVVYTEPF